MTGWGTVLAFEPQERIYYALAGNVAINNCFNAKAMHAAVTAVNGPLKIPSPNYLAAANFGSLELRKSEKNEFIGQPVDYSEQNTVTVQGIALDSIALQRIDLIKIDVEGMELEVLEGAAESIARSHPILVVEAIKSDKTKLQAWLQKQEYQVFPTGLNFLSIHRADPCLAHIKSNTRPAA
jgi:FkbM family methyltransferase